MDLDDERLFCCRQDEPEVAVLAPSVGTLDKRRVCGEETMRVSDGLVVRFPQLLGGGLGTGSRR